MKARFHLFFDPRPLIAGNLAVRADDNARAIVHLPRRGNADARNLRILSAQKRLRLAHYRRQNRRSIAVKADAGFMPRVYLAAFVHQAHFDGRSADVYAQNHAVPSVCISAGRQPS